MIIELTYEEASYLAALMDKDGRKSAFTNKICRKLMGIKTIGKKDYPYEF